MEYYKLLNSYNEAKIYFQQFGKPGQFELSRPYRLYHEYIAKEEHKEPTCECCESGLPATKINGIYCCVRCDNFECKMCKLENDKTGELINWNKNLKMCVCDDCAYIKPVPKIVITDKVVIIRRPKKPSVYKMLYNVVLCELTSKWELVVKQAGMTKKRNKIHKCKDPNATVMDIYQLGNYRGLISSILFKYKPSYDRQLMNYISQNYQAGACGKYQNQTILDYMLINANLFKRLKGEPYIYKSPTSLYELLSWTHQKFYNHILCWEDWWRYNIKSQREKEVAYSVIIQKHLPLDLYSLIIMYL